jgi:uncharacterized protein
MTKSRSMLVVALTMCGVFAGLLLSAAAVKGEGEKGAAQGRHRVVIEVTREGTEQWVAVLNYAENLRKVFGPANTEIEVVGHNAGLKMMLARDGELSGRMKKLADDGVVFAACENSMRKMKLTKADLLPFVAPVDSGVAEVVRKQEAGWSYLKAGV